MPLFGGDIDQLGAGRNAVIDTGAFGHPVKSLRELPAGEYWAQAFVNVYTKFDRADGNIIWAHMDQWEGQQFNKSPGNLYSEAGHFHLDPLTGYEIRLSLDKKNQGDQQQNLRSHCSGIWFQQIVGDSH